MRMSDRRGKGAGSKRGLSLFVAGTIALLAILALPVGASGLWISENTPLEVETVPNSTSMETFQDFMGVQDIDQPNIFLGMYTSSALQITASEITEVDNWLSANGINTGVSIAGTFMDFEFPNPDWNIPHNLDTA